MKPSCITLSAEYYISLISKPRAHQIIGIIMRDTIFDYRGCGTFNTSIAHLAEELNCTPKAIRYTLTDMCDSGLLSISRGKYKGKNGSAVTLLPTGICTINFDIKGKIKGKIDFGKGKNDCNVTTCECDDYREVENSKGKNDLFEQEETTEKEKDISYNISYIKEKEKKEEKKEEKNINKKEVKRFVKPTIQEIQAYLDEQGYTDIDAEYFWHYHESVGWVVGKNKPMKSWRSTIATWRRNNKIKSQQYGTENRKPNSNEQKQADLQHFIESV